jgi:small multidrug resistance pump
MTYTWLLVVFAVMSEIAAALFLRYSNGFTKPLPTVFSLISFASAFYLVSLALVKLPVSTVYPIWAGGGTAGVAFLGILILKEQKNPLKLIGVTMVVAGIVILNMASTGSGI